jgi:hypothetical protein
VFVPDKPFQPNVVCAGEAAELTLGTYFAKHQWRKKSFITLCLPEVNVTEFFHMMWTNI